MFFAAVLLLLAFENVRGEMVVGGLNAPFSEEGFRQVASWKNSRHMKHFLRRVVQYDLKGKIIHEQEFGTVAACCFRDGVPKVTFSELRELLKQAQFTDVKSGDLKDGTLIIVDGQRRATVQKPPELHEGGSLLNVKFEDGNEDSVDLAQVMPRVEVPRIPLWLIPESALTWLHVVEEQVHSARLELQYPIQMATDFLTWRKPATTLSVVAMLLLFATWQALYFMGAWHGVMDELASSGYDVQYFIDSALDICRAVADWTCIGIVVFFYCFYARWFVKVRGVLTIFVRLLTTRRNAPRCWSFFKPEDAPEEVSDTSF